MGEWILFYSPYFIQMKHIFITVVILSVASCTGPTNYKDRSDLIISSSGDKYEIIDINNHKYLFHRGFKDGDVRLVHDPDCPKCRENFIYLVDSIIKSNLK